MNFKSEPFFITKEEQKEILQYAESPPQQEAIQNEHIRKVNEGTKGWSVLCDFTKTELSTSVSRFQGDATVIESVPDIYHEIADRIAGALDIAQDHVFFQYLVVGKGGRVATHYDAGVPGYITYKCNVCVDGPIDDIIHIDKSVCVIEPLDLYCFEANLYRHWMDAGYIGRVHLSYGFLLPYSALGWEEDSPRVRMSNRIWNAYIKRA